MYKIFGLKKEVYFTDLLQTSVFIIEQPYPKFHIQTHNIFKNYFLHTYVPLNKKRFYKSNMLH